MALKNDNLRKELRLLEEAVNRVNVQGKILASCLNGDSENGDADLIEDLRQIIIALHYAIEVLNAKTSVLNKRRSNIIDSQHS